jgi:hypothetical protein
MAKNDAKLTARTIAELRHRNAQRAANILARLMSNAEGTLKSRTGELIEMTSSQIKSAEIALKKLLPDLQSVDSTITMVDERTGEEMMEEAVSFLMKAGMSQEQALEAMKKMAHEATH